MTKTVERLYERFAPEHYDLQLELPSQGGRKFSGSIKLTGKLLKAGPIKLHSVDLKIVKAAVDGKPISVRNNPGEIELGHTKRLTKGRHTVELSYTGKIDEQMHGLYPCHFEQDGQDKELFMTQLESHHAREVFPCVDEPSAKATFNLTLTSAAGVTVLGNMPVASQKTTGQRMVTSFETTPRMSTYLLALVVGDLGFTETTSKHGVKIRVYATPDNVEFTKFALSEAAKILDFYDDYFGIHYPLSKCDLVACPDFSAGAMENWGLTTYRESGLLIYDHDSSADTKQYCATVIAHELAHMWFGDLVTMAWWDDLWLNESFANWMEYYALDHLHPDWKVWEEAGGHDQLYALNRDSLSVVQAVRQAVHSPEEINTNTDYAIVYAKGSCLIRMLHQHIGDKAFQKGLRLYIKRHQYGNATAEDLWRALTQADGVDAAEFMTPWITQPGHPLVQIKDDKLTQKRFFSSPDKIHERHDTLWPIPLLSPAIKQTILDKPSVKVAFDPKKLPLINQGSTGFYHVLYHSEVLESLADNIDKLAIVDRQKLLLDGFFLAKAGYQSTTDLVKLLAHYKFEHSYPVWMNISSVIGALKQIVGEDDDVKPRLQHYVRKLAEPEFKRLGWDHKKNESRYDELLRPIIAGLMVYSEDGGVIKEALKRFDKANLPVDLPSDIRPAIYVAAVRARGRTAFNKLLEWYQNPGTSADERVSLCSGIASVHEHELVNRALRFMHSGKVRLQDVVYWHAYLMRNPHSRLSTWEWTKDNWHWIKKNYGVDYHYDEFVRLTSNTFSTAEMLAEFEKFFTPKLNEIALQRTILQGVEDIKTRIAWRERDFDAVSKLIAKT